MKKHILTIIFIIIASFVLTTAAVDAQGLGDASNVFEEVAGSGSKGAGADAFGKNPEDIIGKGIGAAITLVGMIFLVLMVYAGYLWMTARGEEAEVEKAQKIITAALIGFFIVASAYAITKFVSGKLGGESGEVAPAGDEDKSIDTKAECEAVGGQCISDYYSGGGDGDYDKGYPCDPGGLIGDPFISGYDAEIGTCELNGFDKDSVNTCCMLD